MNTTALAAALGAALVVSAHLVAVAVRRRPATEVAPVRPAPRYVSPDAGAFVAILGQIVMVAAELAAASQTLGDAPLPQVGRVVGNPMRSRQIWIMWPDGRQTYGDLDEFVGMRLASAEERAASLAFLAEVAPMQRYEIWAPFYDHSTDGLIGHGVVGYCDELPGEDEYDDDNSYTDRWHLAEIWSPGYRCGCGCHDAEWGAEVPF